MIDAPARKIALSLVCQFKERGLLVDDFEECWPRDTGDLGVRSIGFWIWTLFGDDEDGYIEKGNNNDFNRILSNTILFLSSQDEFIPKKAGLKNKIKTMLFSGVEWVGCELPWHREWPFPQDKRDPRKGNEGNSLRVKS